MNIEHDYPRDCILVQRSVDEQEAAAALAEEAAELAQAALKYRRTLIVGNPTPVTEEEAHKRLIEEIADVHVCIDVLCCGHAAETREIMLEIRKLKRQKMQRWVERLTEENDDGPEM